MEYFLVVDLDNEGQGTEVCSTFGVSLNSQLKSMSCINWRHPLIFGALVHGNVVAVSDC